MAALVPARSEGRKAMDSSLTRAEKVRRQIKAGRPRKTRTAPSVLEAVQRLCAEADRARGLMRKYGLDPDDISLALLYRVGAPGSLPIQCAELPPPGNIGPFIQRLEYRNSKKPVAFLGILWQQTDREATAAKAPHTIWITESTDDKSVSMELLAYWNEKMSRSKRG